MDPADPAHSALVALLGAKAKHEVVRARHRTLAAMRAQTVEQGRFLGGRPPYGYRLVDAGPHPNRAEAAWGRRLHRLGPGCGDCGPRAVDDCPPLKGRSLAGGNRVGGMWSVTTVKTILSNPRYAGREVWNRRQAVGGASDGCAARLTAAHIVTAGFSDFETPVGHSRVRGDLHVNHTHRGAREGRGRRG